MKQILLFSVILQLAFAVSLRATHIVGGEFELIHLEEYNYQLSLIQYFDQVNGSPGAEDLYADVYIFRKSDDAFMEVRRLFNDNNSTFVPYTDPACTNDQLITRRILYTAQLELPPATYNDPEGYYIVYERCCRNYNITNLTDPRETGQTFYLEFPPVVVADEFFKNSSPQLFPPLSDYACINELFYFDFRGTDKDGDSLSYRLSVPLNSSIFSAVPTPTPAPHPEVELSSGLDINTMVPGAPSLFMDSTGFLRVRPNQLGLFVFAVTVDEFRNGKKIGSLNRDFQMLVIDCQTGTPPQVSARVPGRPEIYKGVSEVIKFAAEDEKCVQLLVTDPDAPERITIKAKAVNFQANMNEVFPPVTQFTKGAGDTLIFNICLPNCPLTDSGPAIIDFLVMDDACSLPLLDTIRMIFDVEAINNAAPFIVDNQEALSVNLNAGETYELVVQGKDNDGDILSLDVVSDIEGFRLQDYGMTFQTLAAGPGEITKVFRWTPNCEDYELDTFNQLGLKFQLEDGSGCLNSSSDSLKVDFQVTVPQNQKPLISTTGLNTVDTTIFIGETLTFSVIGTDPDNDFLTLEAVGEGFELLDLGINFQNTSGIGRVGSVFSWRVLCENLDLTIKDEFQFLFILTDQGACNTSDSDTIRVNVRVVPTANVAPEISINGPVEETGPQAFEAQAVVGSQIFFRVTGTDADNDILVLRLDKVLYGDAEIRREDVNFNFFDAQGIGQVASQFYWIPDCIFLKEGFQDSEFKLFFSVTEQNCFESKAASLTITLKLTDKPLGFEAFEPPNVFTPNGDDKNQYFELPNLPIGSCARRFESIEIYNRWGKPVYISQEREFRWYGDGAPQGLYFYQIKYGDFLYKGTVSLLR